MPPSDTVADLLLLWEEAHEAGRDLTPEELCRGYPDCLSEVQRRIGQLLRFNSWLQDAPTPHLGGTDSSASRQFPFPTIPGYEVSRWLGGGGMGDLYLARHRDLDQIRVVKVMKVGLAPDSQRFVRFEREMRALARMKHPHIVPIYEAKLHEGQPYFVMPYIAEGSLDKHLDSFHHQPRAVAGLMEQVARGVAHAHDMGVLHRDLKPSNILLDQDGQALVSDFGIAKLLDTPSQNEAPSTPSWPGVALRAVLTAEGAQIGTLPYMSPEQIVGDRDRLDPRTDVWALGVILYQLLTGRLPFDAPSWEQQAQQIREQTPPTPHQLDSVVDSTLSAIVMRCLEKDSARRYQSASDVARDLAAWRAGQRVPGVREAWGRWTKRQWRRLRIPIVGSALAVAAVAFLASQQESPGRVEPIDPADSFRRTVTPLLDELKAGRPVRFAGKGVAQPAGYLRFGAGKVIPVRDGEFPGSLSLDATGPVLMELLPHVSLDRYQVEVELQQETSRASGTDCRVGVYLGYNEYQDHLGTHRLFLDLEYDHLGRAAVIPDSQGQVGTWVELRARLLCDSPEYHHRSHGASIRLKQFVARDPEEPNPTRTLRLDVRPETIRASWDREEPPFATFGPEERTRMAMNIQSAIPHLFPNLVAMPIRFPIDGPIGIFAVNCRISVRRFDVSPLPN